MNPPYETYVTIVFILQIRKLRVGRVSSSPKVTELGKGRVWTGTLSGLANASNRPPLSTILYRSGSQCGTWTSCFSITWELVKIQSRISWIRNSGGGAQQSNLWQTLQVILMLTQVWELLLYWTENMPRRPHSTYLITFFIFELESVW